MISSSDRLTYSAFHVSSNIGGSLLGFPKRSDARDVTFSMYVTVGILDTYLIIDIRFFALNHSSTTVFNCFGTFLSSWLSVVGLESMVCTMVRVLVQIVVVITTDSVDFHQPNKVVLLYAVGVICMSDIAIIVMVWEMPGLMYTWIMTMFTVNLLQRFYCLMVFWRCGGQVR